MPIKYGPGYSARVPRVNIKKVAKIFNWLQPLVRSHLRPRPHTYNTRYAQAAAQSATQETYDQCDANHMYHPITGNRENFDQLKEQDPERWEKGMGNEMGRLAQGIGPRMKEGIQKYQVPTCNKVACANAICYYCLLKDDPYRVQLTVGGDKLDYNGDSSAPAASLIDLKLIFNSTISTEGAKFLTTDIKDSFLNNPMESFEYMKIPLRWFPQDVIDQYDIMMSMVEPDGFIYVDIRKGMYGLKQAARIAFDCLVTLMKPHGYAPLRCNPGIWRHEKRDVLFTLCVDDFGIKYSNLDNANHLLNTLQKYYKISTDW